LMERSNLSHVRLLERLLRWTFSVEADTPSLAMTWESKQIYLLA
jgi:hypothetical protein